jgi:hypothetical protein
VKTRAKTIAFIAVDSDAVSDAVGHRLPLRIDGRFTKSMNNQSTNRSIALLSFAIDLFLAGSSAHVLRLGKQNLSRHSVRWLESKENKQDDDGMFSSCKVLQGCPFPHFLFNLNARLPAIFMRSCHRRPNRKFGDI